MDVLCRFPDKDIFPLQALPYHRREWEHCLKFQGQDGPWFYVFDLKPELRAPDLPGRQDRGGLLGPGSLTCMGPQQTLGEEGLLLAHCYLLTEH